MSSLIVAHAKFEQSWPFVADELAKRMGIYGDASVVRLELEDDSALSEKHAPGSGVERLVVLGVPVTTDSLALFPDLKEVALASPYRTPLPDDVQAELEARGITLIRHKSEGFWGQSVSEYALALTLCGLRRIPQTHHEIITSHDAWNKGAPDGKGGRMPFYGQCSDDRRFTSGMMTPSVLITGNLFLQISHIS